MKEGELEPPCSEEADPVYTFTSIYGNKFHYEKYVCGKYLRNVCFFLESEKAATEAIELSDYKEITTISGNTLRYGTLHGIPVGYSSPSGSDKVIAVCSRTDDGKNIVGLDTAYTQAWDYVFVVKNENYLEEELSLFELILKSINDPDL